MRNNSLKYQISWHSKQQTHIFKKICKEESSMKDNPPPSTPIPAVQRLTHQNEFQWLEKMVNDLHQYNEGLYGEQQKKECEKLETLGINTLASNILETSKKINIDQNKKVPVEGTIENEQSGKKTSLGEKVKAKKSLKKIKFETANQENRRISVKKAQKSTSKQKTNEKVKNSNKKQEKNSKKKLILQKSCDKVNLGCVDKEESSQINQISILKTDPYFLRQSQDMMNDSQIAILWKKPSANLDFSQIGFDNKSRSEHRKSVGKIVRNSQSEIGGLQKQTKNEVEKPLCLVPKGHTKIGRFYINLRTQKLSEYLIDGKANNSQKKDENVKIDTNEVQKYIQTRRSQILALDYQNQQQKADNQINESLRGVRTRSEQRRLNKCVQILKPRKLYDSLPKNNKTAANIESTADLFDQTIQRTRRAFIYLDQMNQLKRQLDIQKKQTQKDIDILSFRGRAVKQSRELQDQLSFQQHKASPRKIDQNRNESTVFSPSKEMDKQNQKKGSNKQKKEKEYCLQIASVRQSIKIIFSLLDAGAKGFLSGSNCQVQALTEELKLLFSSVLNQIKTKKKNYTQELFLEESEQVLKVKSEVYAQGRVGGYQSIILIADILRENLELIKSRSPMNFIKSTVISHTGSNFCSKRSSFNSNQSIVVGKVKVNTFQGRNSQKGNLESIPSFRDLKVDCADLYERLFERKEKTKDQTFHEVKRVCSLVQTSQYFSSNRDNLHIL